MDRLTRVVLFNLLRRDGEDTKYFGQEVHNGIGHFGVPWKTDKDFQSVEYVFDAFEDSNELFSTTLDSSGGLNYNGLNNQREAQCRE
jgi:hypothetical protein